MRNRCHDDITRVRSARTLVDPRSHVSHRIVRSVYEFNFSIVDDRSAVSRAEHVYKIYINIYIYTYMYVCKYMYRTIRQAGRQAVVREVLLYIYYTYVICIYCA